MLRIYNKDEPRQGKIISRQDAAKLLEADNNVIRKRMFSWWDDNMAWQKIPCKKCWACQLNYSAEWATRIMLEAKAHECNYWLTLTYDDEHLPIAEEIKYRKETYTNDGTWTSGTLYDKDVKTFINSLRQKYHRKGHDGIKYFYCGEYGSTTERPHYHIILLNCPLDITQFHDCHVDSNYKAHWKSNEIENYWNKGIIDLCELEWSNAAYTARYCTKKLNTHSKEWYCERGKIPEYVQMSKGIAFNYLKDHLNEIYDTDEIIMRTVKGNVGSAKPPKAFDRKLEQWDPEMLEMIKESRKKAGERAEKLRLTLSDYTDYQQLNIDAEKVQKKMQMLPRVGEW